MFLTIAPLLLLLTVLSPDEPPRVTGQEIHALTQQIRSGTVRDLESIRALVPRIFEDEFNREAFFTEFTGFNQLPDYPGGREIRELVSALSEYAIKSHRNGNHARAHEAMQLAVDALLQVISLPVPSGRHFTWAWASSAVGGSLQDLRQAMSTIYGAASAPVERTMRLRSLIRSYSRWQSAVLELVIEEEEAMYPLPGVLRHLGLGQQQAMRRELDLLRMDLFHLTRPGTHKGQIR